MADDPGGSAASGEAEASDRKRGYGVFSAVMIDFSEEPGAIVEKLKAAIGKLPSGEEITQSLALVRVGRANETTPPNAVRAVGQVVDLDGTYEVIADSARKEIPNVKFKTTRDVSIG